ncbi:MAG: hypothetical protein P8Z80_14745 [Pseudolabrys sp.]
MFANSFIACGMIWNGVCLFQGWRLLPFAVFAGAEVWPLPSPFPTFAHDDSTCVTLCAVASSSTAGRSAPPSASARHRRWRLPSMSTIC